MVEWGWNPDSFAAVGTVGALCATAWVVVQDALARYRKQAEQVVIWIDYKTSDQRSLGLIAESEDDWWSFVGELAGQHVDAETFLCIRNESASPVMRVHVASLDGDIPVIAPGKTVKLSGQQDFGGLLSPRSSF